MILYLNIKFIQIKGDVFLLLLTAESTKYIHINLIPQNLIKKKNRSLY